MEDAETDEQIRNKLSMIFAQAYSAISDHFLLALDQGQLSQESDPQALAQMTISMTHSFAARACRQQSCAA